MCGEWVLYSFFGVGLSFAAYTAAALLHEGGHALTGYFAGAKCLWIRVGGLLWVPGGGSFVKRQGATPPGECVLLCQDKKTCMMAAFGGSIVNFLTGIIAGGVWMCAGRFLWGIHWAFYIAVLVFSVCSLGMALLNLCPVAPGTGNDGEVIKRLCKEPGFYERMQINQQRDMVRLEFGILEELF